MEKTQNMKMTSIRLIPEDWEVITIAAVGQDFSYGVGAEAIPYNGEDKYIRITDINDESHKYTPSPVTSPSFFYENHLLKKNDIVVARTGASVGKSYLYDIKDGKLVFAGFLMKFNVPNVDARYVAYHLSTTRYWQWVNSESARTGQPGLNIQQMKQFTFPSPTNLQEQKGIADALSGVDNLIGALDEAIAKKKQIKEGLMQQLLIGKTRLPGFSGDWEERRLDSFEIVNGSMLKSSDYETGSVPVIAGGRIPAGFHSEANRPADTISISGSGAYAGFVSFHSVPIFASDCSTINDPKNADILYLYFCLLFKQKEIYKCQAGGAQPHVHAKDIKDITIMMPSSVKEQKVISAVLTKSDDEIKGLETQRDKYQLIKQGMMQELLTGKTRLI